MNQIVGELQKNQPRVSIKKKNTKDVLIIIIEVSTSIVAHSKYIICHYLIP